MSKVLSGEKHGDVGRHFGIKPAAVSNVLKDMEAWLETDKGLISDVRKLKRELLNVI